MCKGPKVESWHGWGSEMRFILLEQQNKTGIGRCCGWRGRWGLMGPRGDTGLWLRNYCELFLVFSWRMTQASSGVVSDPLAAQQVFLHPSVPTSMYHKLCAQQVFVEKSDHGNLPFPDRARSLQIPPPQEISHVLARQAYLWGCGPARFSMGSAWPTSLTLLMTSHPVCMPSTFLPLPSFLSRRLLRCYSAF